MSTPTSNYGLVKPDLTDTADIGVLNGNMDTLDTTLHTIYGSTTSQLTALAAALGLVSDGQSASGDALARLANLVQDLGQEADAANSSGSTLARLAYLISLVNTIYAYETGTIQPGIGAQADAASATGSANAKLKDIKNYVSSTILGYLNGTTAIPGLGSTGDAANSSGSTLARLAYLISLVNPITQAPVTGVKTVTATPAEVFAGASALTTRCQLTIKNEDQALRMRVGSSTVNQQTGFPVEPGAAWSQDFNPANYIPIYAVSEGASLNMAVMEE
jgi:hypothetical protein